jgi:hypothetical protein
MIDRMERQRRRWRTVVAAALAVGLLYGASREAFSGVIGNDRWNWAEMAVYCMAWALVMPLIWGSTRWMVDRAWFPQNPARKDQERAAEILRPVLRSGVLPDDIDRGAWRRAMRDAKQQLEAGFWFWLGVNLIIAALTAAAAIVANDNAWTVWAVAVVVAAQGAVGARLLWPKLRTARRLLAELSDDAARRP